MVRESIARWLKCTLCTLIVALWISCICLIFLACWIRDNLTPIIIIAEKTPVGDFYINAFFPVVFPVLIATSCLSLIIGFLGCCGACTENKVLLVWFFFAIVISFCVETSAVVWGRLDWNLYYREEDVDLLYQNVKRLDEHGKSWLTRTWSDIHQKFHCCGVYSHKDWSNMPHILATCATDYDGSITHKDVGCGAELLKYLTGPSPIRAVPYLATMIGTIQVICLIITAKLWMMACIRTNPTSCETKHNELQTHQPFQHPSSNGSTPHTGSQSHTATGRPKSSRYIAVKNVAGKQCPDWQESLQSYCHQCAMRAYEEARLVSASTLETDYQQMYERAHPPRRLQSHRCSEEAIHGVYAGTNTRGCGRASSATDLGMKKSASYNLPPTWRSSSWSSMNHHMRAYNSASLPRKKYPYHSPQWRHRTPRSYIRRLSTIRASGVPAESDLSSDRNRCTNIEELGGSRCYNTEADSSSSESEGESPPTSSRVRHHSVPGNVKTFNLEAFEEKRLSSLLNQRPEYPTL